MAQIWSSPSLDARQPFWPIMQEITYKNVLIQLLLIISFTIKATYFHLFLPVRSFIISKFFLSILIFFYKPSNVNNPANQNGSKLEWICFNSFLPLINCGSNKSFCWPRFSAVRTHLCSDQSIIEMCIDVVAACMFGACLFCSYACCCMPKR